MKKEKEYKSYSEFLKSKSYQLDNKEYKTYSNFFKKNFLKHLPINKDVNILDIGCGMGHFLFFLRENKYKNIIGIDFDMKNIEICKLLGFEDSKCVDMYDFIKKDENKYDVIILNDVIEHIPKNKLTNFLNDCERILNKNGLLIFKTVNCNNIYGISSFFADFTHEIGFTKEKILQLTFLTGFKKSEIFNIYIYPNIFILDQLLYLFSWTLYKVKTILFLINGRKGNDIHSKNLLAILKK